MLGQLDAVRFIQIFIVQGFMSFLYFFMAYLILRRGTKRLNLNLTAFYLSIGIAGVINMIYAPMQIFFGPSHQIVYMLHFITYYLYCISLIFLLLFILIILKSDRVISLKVEILSISLFGLLLLGLWFIPGGIQFNTYDAKPHWNWAFGIYSFIICSMVIIPTLYYSLVLYRKFDFEELQKKWRYFILGESAFFFLYYGTTLSNMLNDPGFRTLWSILGIFSLVLLSCIYLGVGKQL